MCTTITDKQPKHSDPNEILESWICDIICKIHADNFTEIHNCSNYPSDKKRTHKPTPLYNVAGKGANTETNKSVHRKIRINSTFFLSQCHITWEQLQQLVVCPSPTWWAAASAVTLPDGCASVAPLTSSLLPCCSHSTSK